MCQSRRTIQTEVTGTGCKCAYVEAKGPLAPPLGQVIGMGGGVVAKWRPCARPGRGAQPQPAVALGERGPEAATPASFFREASSLVHSAAFVLEYGSEHMHFNVCDVFPPGVIRLDALKLSFELACVSFGRVPVSFGMLSCVLAQAVPYSTGTFPAPDVQPTLSPRSLDWSSVFKGGAKPSLRTKALLQPDLSPGWPPGVFGWMCQHHLEGPRLSATVSGETGLGSWCLLG